MPPMETNKINKSNSELKKLNPVFHLRSLNSANKNISRIRIDSNRVYTIGRKRRHCDIIIDSRYVSKRHCQLHHNPFEHRLQLTDGCFLDKNLDPYEKVSLNGVFVNGERVQKGSVVDLRDKDEIVVGPDEKFIVEECEDEAFDEMSERNLLANKAVSVLGKCQSILNSTDPVSDLRNLEIGNSLVGVCLKQNDFDEVKFSRNDTTDCRLRENAMIDIRHSGINIGNGTAKDFFLNENLDKRVLGLEDLDRNDVINKRNTVGRNLDICNGNDLRQTSCSYNVDSKDVKITENGTGKWLALSKNPAVEVIDLDDSDEYGDKIDKHDVILDEDNRKDDDRISKAIDNFDLGESSENYHYSNGKCFFLNRIENMGTGKPEHEAKTITLPELLYPVGSILRVFLATFTSDVAWFLSYCQLPYHLPITIACHSAEKCWSSSRENRTSAPFSYYPNLLLVYPQFPDEIAFGKDRKKRGVACHHPKLIVLQRKDCIRVIVTSANLNSKQWKYVTNTIWWQDFPSRSSPDCSSLFCTLQDTNNDFAAQLSGFIASLISNVTSQAHWITELTKYDFREAGGYLVASIPGIHSKRPFSETNHFLLNKNVQRSHSDAKRYLGSIQASVVGLSHRFCTGVDSGGQLKILASYLGKFQEISMGMLEVKLKRNTNIAADYNAMSVVVADIDEFSDGAESVQLGFLPRDVAKWVSPLSDAGFFSFSVFISPKETLTAILDGNNTKVPLVLHVLQGAKFDEISRLIQDDHVAPLCSLLASIQRPLGLWRLHEVLSRYKWPDSLETEFMYVSSSIGTSINPQYIAAFSSAAGKRSVQFSESEESDPEWGCWTYKYELKNPSLRILFPTIERVKNALYGVCSSRRLLSLSEKTWKRLKLAGIFHDAVPNPSNRQGYPMHVKVAQRRFQYKKEGTPSFGWVYCGSHNFSPAAWGQESNIRGSKLHICNYELGIVLISPPYDAYSDKRHNNSERCGDLDDIVLPFVTPPPKYKNDDRPATAQAMREAMAEAAVVQIEETAEDVPSESEEEEEEIEDEIVDGNERLSEEKEEEKIYAEMLWSQLDSCGS